MKYVFFGSPEFAAIILEKLIIDGFIPEAVVCNPDRPVGRKKIITPPAVKVLAQKNGIKVYQPEHLEIENWKSEIDEVDFAVVAAYAQIIPKEILEVTKLGTIGVHASILPKHRGPSPIQTAILNGDEKTGTTLFLMDQKIDHGPILAKSEILISKSETYASLHDKLAEWAARLLIVTLHKFIEGKIKPQEQDESQATYTKKFKTEDGFVDLDKDEPEVIERKVRALNPEPGAWTMKNGKRMKILESKLVDGKLKITKMQIEGKKPQNI